MLSYLVKRLLISLLVLFGLSLLAFSLVRLVPGDTVTAMLGMNYEPEAAARLREKYALDRPLVVQYAVWLGGIVRGDLGQTTGGRPVAAELAEALPVTLQLAGQALAFAILVGIPLGMLAAVRRGKPTDAGVSVISLIGLSVPGFWAGTLLILVVALHLEMLPSGRFVPLTVDPVENLRHMILPSIALGLAVMAVLTRMTRSSMLEVVGQDFVRTAKAKGVSPFVLMAKHVARNGIIPVLTIAGLQAGYLLGGSIVIEEVFSLPGVGALVLRALGDRDYSSMQAVILLIGAVFLLVNFIVDVLHAWADPRVSLE